MLLYILPSLLLGVRLVPRNVLFGICGLVPLAYLVSIGTRDLYRIDRLAARCLVHAATITVLGTLLFIIAAQLQLWGTAASTLLALSFVVLYRPTQRIVARALPSRYVLHQHHAALDDTISRLAQTLDSNQLVAILAEGMRAAFSQPVLAVYTGNIYGSNELHLRIHDRFADLPTYVAAGTLTTMLRQFERPVDSRRLNHDVDTNTLTENEYQLVAQPGIVVWMPIHHSQGHLLGVVLLGMRGDLDPYRTEDMVALQRVLSAASLAFTNSAAFAQQQEAEAMIRQLYRRLQTTQDTMTRELAHELHDEIINVHVRLNILSLADVRHHVANQEALGEIDTVLESLHTMSDDLRSMCEQLYPTGLDDPFGLGAVLRTQLRKEQARWNGECRFEETGQPVPISAQVQREALRITKEAVTNAIKHADAHTIVVHLAYPDAPHPNIQLSITDDGVGTGRLAERAGHFGLRYMRESAGAAGGTLRIDAQPAGGTRIVFMFPAPGSAHHTIGVFQGDDHATA